MKKQTKHKTMFSLEIENNKEGHHLSIALGMIGLNISPSYAKLILETQEMMKKMGGKFDLKTASEMKYKFHKHLEQLQDKYDNQKP